MRQLLADPDSQWHEYRSRGPITKNQVAALLKDFEIRPVVVHPTKRADLSRHGYRVAQFEDAFARFLPPEPKARSDTHAEGKSSTSSTSSGARAPSGSESGRAGAARLDTPSSHGEAGKGQQSIHSGGNQAGKNVGAPTPGGADSGIDTSIAPSRTSDRGQRSGQEKPVANSSAGRNTHRGVQPVPHASNRPLRNAIGIPLSPQQNPETRDRTHPSPFGATREAPGVTTALPGYSTRRVTTAGIGPRHYAPN